MENPLDSAEANGRTSDKQAPKGLSGLSYLIETEMYFEMGRVNIIALREGVKNVGMQINLEMLQNG